MMTDQNSPTPCDRFSADVNAWLMRCYETQEAWKKKAREVFMVSNGDSVLSRIRVAAMVRKYFLEERPQAEEVDRWNESYEHIEKVYVEPPSISESNAGYVDWLYVADYLLLACAGITDEITEENQLRETEYQQSWSSYQLRLAAYAARSLIREHPDMDDDGVKKLLDERIKELLNDPRKKASNANVQEARRLEAAKLPHVEPMPPERPEPMPRHKSIYFPSVADRNKAAVN